MNNVIDLHPRLPAGISARHEGVYVRVLYVGSRKMTHGLFKQIPIAKSRAWPEKYLGWVRTPGGPFLIYQDDSRRLRRMNIGGLGIVETDGTQIPGTDFAPQLFIG